MSLDTTNGSLLWYLGRGSGITAFLLVTVAVALGIAVSRRWFAGPIPRLVVHDLHRWVTLTFYVFVALHVVTIWLDPFTHFRLVDVLVPFASTYRPLWMSLGIIAAELSIAVGASVWVRSRIGYRAWHALHGLTYPIFLASLVHGLGAGTDTRTTWATALYGGSVALVAGLTLWRTASIPRLRAPSVAAVLVLVTSLVIWGAGGPYADGWAVASGTPNDLLAKASAEQAMTAPTTTASSTAAAPAFPALNQVTLSGQTEVSEDLATVTLIGTTSGAAKVDIAIQFANERTVTNGTIQIRDARQTPLCDGTVHSTWDGTLIATCAGYGQTHQLQITFQRLNRAEFSAVLSDSGSSG